MAERARGPGLGHGTGRDGQANEALLQLFAQVWRLPRRDLSIAVGAASRSNIVCVAGDSHQLSEAICARSRPCPAAETAGRVDKGLLSLVIAGGAFCGSHALLSSTRLRGSLRDQLGERGFLRYIR